MLAIIIILSVDDDDEEEEGGRFNIGHESVGIITIIKKWKIENNWLKRTEKNYSKIWAQVKCFFFLSSRDCDWRDWDFYRV